MDTPHPAHDQSVAEADRSIGHGRLTMVMQQVSDVVKWAMAPWIGQSCVEPTHRLQDIHTRKAERCAATQTTRPGNSHFRAISLLPPFDRPFPDRKGRAVHRKTSSPMFRGVPPPSRPPCKTLAPDAPAQPLTPKRDRERAREYSPIPEKGLSGVYSWHGRRRGCEAGK
jgi:hypothetical protein